MKWQNIVRTVQKGNLISHREGASGCIRNRYRMHYTDLSIIINDVMDQSFAEKLAEKYEKKLKEWKIGLILPIPLHPGPGGASGAITRRRSWHENWGSRHRDCAVSTDRSAPGAANTRPQKAVK